MKIKVRTRDVVIEEITPEGLARLPQSILRELLMPEEETQEQEGEGAMDENIVEHEASKSGGDEETPSRMEVIRKAMSRRSVPWGQRQLYHYLYQAGDKGLGKAALADAMGRTENQLTGVLGALGNRVNHTMDQLGSRMQPGGIYLMLNVSKKNGELHYSLREDFRQHLEEQGYDWLDEL